MRIRLFVTLLTPITTSIWTTFSRHITIVIGVRITVEECRGNCSRGDCRRGDCRKGDCGGDWVNLITRERWGFGFRLSLYVQRVAIRSFRIEQMERRFFQDRRRPYRSGFRFTFYPCWTAATRRPLPIWTERKWRSVLRRKNGLLHQLLTWHLRSFVVGIRNAKKCAEVSTRFWCFFVPWDLSTIRGFSWQRSCWALSTFLTHTCRRLAILAPVWDNLGAAPLHDWLVSISRDSIKYCSRKTKKGERRSCRGEN